MAWFEWLGTWSASLSFGVATILILLGVECLVLARRAYRSSRSELEEGAALGAEFGIFSAPSARLESAPVVPRSCYSLLALGGSSLLAALALLVLCFA